ncbi:type VI secretion system protein VasD [Pseudomonas sp. SJZ101]|nr:type VI secretion system protein VasD [Pseudomonas sp. SJZ075]TWC26626.1 type VI secretion system protein VasD [Pseudomonas sp. SJZ078]TWC45367.1 type VI secretion system protein VasD [Pseudomonas sp. SJZ124]TWC46141.1 type VI secretion system protein VasD [Pseudomonas sp. SJZ080]TWC80448.1 type VI secretion system protein VasD [Pseudomonas sp. SJZ101]
MAVIDARTRWCRAGAGSLVLGVLLLLQGCQMVGWFQDPPVRDPQKTLHMEAALDANPNLYGRPSPLMLTVYQLSDAKTFLKVDLSRLGSADQQPTDSAWLTRETFQLSPGELRIHRFVPALGVRLLGVVAEYRDLDNAQWRAVEVFQAQSPVTLNVTVARDAVSIQAIPILETP